MLLKACTRVVPWSLIKAFSLFSTSSTKAGKLESSKHRRSRPSISPGGRAKWWYATGRDSPLSPKKYYRQNKHLCDCAETQIILLHQALMTSLFQKPNENDILLLRRWTMCALQYPQCLFTQYQSVDQMAESSVVPEKAPWWREIPGWRHGSPAVPLQES